MYDTIERRPSIPDAYAQQLEVYVYTHKEWRVTACPSFQSEGVSETQSIATMSKEYFSHLGDTLKKSATHQPPVSLSYSM